MPDREAAAQPRPSEEVLASVRILFGLTDSVPARWDGAITVLSQPASQTGHGNSVKAIQGVRFGPEDSTDYVSSWKASTRAQGQEVLSNGVMVTVLAQPESRWSVHTPRGDFSFTLADLKWGDSITFLDGAVEVDRVPSTAQLTTSDDDEDFPAIAKTADKVWLTYTRFSHSDRSQESFATLSNPPAGFDSLARPAGGDRVFATQWQPASNSWSKAEPVSPKGENISSSAVAIDGSGRVWVIWSAQRSGSFDLFARAGQKGNWGPEIRLTSAKTLAGPNLNPVAATDSSGRVWVAWQGFRNSRLQVLTAVQNGDSFSPEIPVSSGAANSWDPSIAAAPSGDVAIAWDTYARGDYDVYFRRAHFDSAKGAAALEEPIAAAATPLFEARPTIAFDARNRLWLAYEVAGSRWGKNYGQYETAGVPLYEDRNIRVKVFDGEAELTPSADLLNVLPGSPMGPRRVTPVPVRGRAPLQPNENAARNRRPGQQLGPRAAPLNAFPRLAIDAAGGVFLTFRSLLTPVNIRSPLGSIWVENAAYFDGHKWIGPIFIPRTDGTLETRPALVPLAPGRLLAVSAMDHRQSIPQGLGQPGAERINSDLYVADLRFDGLSAPAPNPELAPIPKQAAAPADPRAIAEEAQVALVRDYRIPASGRQLRILRGDFHRYTEYSLGGTRDGSLEDAYRYAIDAAALDWGACCDNDNGAGHEYFWWREQTAADEFDLPGRFVSLFGFEHEARYPEGHRSILFAKRGIRPMPHLTTVPVDSPPSLSAPDTQTLYRYLKTFGGISVPYGSATDIGTDWRDNDSSAEPAVEVYEGNRQSYEDENAPRAARPGDALGNLRPAGYIVRALDKGYRLGFTAGSDHNSTHSAFTNVLAPDASRAAILDALKSRHVYASTDNIVADVRCGEHLMGDDFSVPAAPRLSVKLIGSAAFSKVVIVKDGKEVSVTTPNSKDVSFDWTDNAAQAGKASYYYVRGEQNDGQLVWVSPMWITLK